jgi:protein ImuB
MPVPSYDDLTPSISDVHPRDTFDQVTELVPSNEPVVTCDVQRPAAPKRASAEAGATCDQLYACVRGANAEALVALARDFSPRIERHGDGCVVLDISGLGRLLGDGNTIAAELARAAGARGLEATIAVAPTQTAAQLLTLAGNTSVVLGDVAPALAPLSLELLRPLTPGPKPPTPSPHPPPPILDVLKRWGLRTIGEFAALSSSEISARFGQKGVVLQRLARGIDERPLRPDPGVPRFVQSLELEWPIEELEPLSFVFARLLDPLSSALEYADRAGAAIRVDLRLVDRTIHSRMLQLPAPIRDPRVLRTLLLLDLESHPPSAGIDVVRIEVDPAPSRIVQYSLLERAIPSPETLATMTARLSALSGESRCGSPSLLDSHRPDAFEMQRFNPEGRRTSASTQQHPAAPCGTLVLRRFRPPVAVRVATDRGRPMHIANLRKGIPCGRVEQAAGPWRSSGAWWSGTSEHWDRDEWDVALADGSICRLYRDRTTGRWFVEGVFD